MFLSHFIHLWKKHVRPIMHSIHAHFFFRFYFTVDMPWTFMQVFQKVIAYHLLYNVVWLCMHAIEPPTCMWRYLWPIFPYFQSIKTWLVRHAQNKELHANGWRKIKKVTKQFSLKVYCFLYETLNAVWNIFHELIKYAWQQDVSFVIFKKHFFAYNCWPLEVNLLCDPQL